MDMNRIYGGGMHAIIGKTGAEKVLRLANTADRWGEGILQSVIRHGRAGQRERIRANLLGTSAPLAPRKGSCAAPEQETTPPWRKVEHRRPSVDSTPTTKKRRRVED